MAFFNCSLVVTCGGEVCLPVCAGRIIWQTSRRGAPGALSFTMLGAGEIPLAEGDEVNFLVGGEGVFRGYVFKITRGASGGADVLCYDQLRYLKNRDSLVYENRTASELVRSVCSECGLKTGQIDETGYRISSRVETNAAYLDMIGNALDITFGNTGRAFVLYDDYGSVSLREGSSLRADCVITADSCRAIELSSSIDDGVYNSVKLRPSRENSADVFTARDPAAVARWGLLRYSGIGSDPEALLKLYCSPTRTVYVRGAAGDLSVRGGAAVAIDAALPGENLHQYMLADRVKHVFQPEGHTMDIWGSVV